MLSRRFDSFFNDLFFGFDDLSDFQEFHSNPKSKVIKIENGVKIYAEIPGFSKDEISVTISDDHILTIEGQKTEEKTNKYISKLKENGFVNKYNISNYDKDKIEAEIKDGILTIILKYKNEEIEKEKKIEIKCF